MKTARFEELVAFAQKKHKGQTRACDAPAWHHLVRVSRLLTEILSVYKEGSVADRAALPRAALGHDILEDTTATREEVTRLFGVREAALIWVIKNEEDDAHTDAYRKKVAESDEAARILKLADLYDNYTNVAYALPCLGAKWTHSYFLPIVEPMFARIRKTRFQAYRHTAGALCLMVASSQALLAEALARDDGKRTRYSAQRRKSS